MGSCLSQLVRLGRIPVSAPGLAQDRPGRPGPARCPRPWQPLRVQRVHRVLPSAVTASRRSAPAQPGTPHKRFPITPKRRYPLHQPQYRLGSLPRVCWHEGDKKVTIRRRSNRTTVRIPAPSRKPLHSVLLSSPAGPGPGPGAPEQEPTGLDGSRGGGSRGASVPKAESRESPGEPVSMCMAGILSSGSRNAIASSYSALQRIHGPHLCRRRSPAPARLQTPQSPTSKAREALCVPPSSSQSRQVPHKEPQGAKDPGPHTQRQQKSGTGCSGARKRKIPLLRPRRGVPLTLPPAPKLGYPITVEDLEQEKRARLRRITEVFLDKTEATSSPVMEKPPFSQQPLVAASMAPVISGLAPAPSTAAVDSNASLCPAPAFSPAFGFGATTMASSSQLLSLGASQASEAGGPRPSATGTFSFPGVTGMASSTSNTTGALSFGASTPFGVGEQPSQLPNVLPGAQPFASGGPSFTIGVGSKTQDARQILEARRKHRKK
ncbi:nuclear envelope pore membrane protein POM 121-like [Dipodomys merriami]|uniref:nuclear envelope pore membrane protein POM 121-like n=1 Tax=Dipodomys merriami TaxID=94247 RepID=UPI003855C722